METPIATNSLVMGSLVCASRAISPAPHGRHRCRARTRRARGASHVARARRLREPLGERARGARRRRAASRVATVLANSLELLATYWSCAKLGAVAVPLSPLLTATGLVVAARRRVAAGRRRLERSARDAGRRASPDESGARAGVGADRRRGRRRGAGLPRLRAAHRGGERRRSGRARSMPATCGR